MAVASLDAAGPGQLPHAPRTTTLISAVKEMRPIRDRGRDPNNPAEYPARYEADWLRRRTRRALVRAAIVVVAFTLFVWPLSWPGALVVACLAGAVHFLYCWRRHHLATAWHKDAYAERRSVRVLRPLLKRGYVVLHDRHCGSVRVQSLLIGPTGAWLVHAVGRSVQRRMWGDAAYLHPEDQPEPPDADELRDRARRVGEALGGEMGGPVPVRPVVIVVGNDTPDPLRDGGTVAVVDVGAFLAYVEDQPESLSPGDVDRIATAAESALAVERPRSEGPDLPLMAERKSLWSRRGGPRFVRETEVGRKPKRRDRRDDGGAPGTE